MKLLKRRKPIQIPEKALDRFSERRRRGRPVRIPRSWVIGRADNYRRNLTQVWTKLGGPLLAAETEEQVIAAFENYGEPYAGNFVPLLAADVCALIHAPGFPKRPKAQVGFLADSLGGRPRVTFRTSRDICARERAKQRAVSPHKIIRKEFYIECECGYKGPAQDNACRECGATIPISLEITWGSQLRF